MKTKLIKNLTICLPAKKCAFCAGGFNLTPVIILNLTLFSLHFLKRLFTTHILNEEINYSSSNKTFKTKKKRKLIVVQVVAA